jgi:hypothetical protein
VRESPAVPRRIVLLPLALVVLAAGCGGTKAYSLQKTRACLAKEQGVRLAPVPASDFIAQAAPGGALRVVVGENQVTISFGRDQKESDRIAQGYRTFRGKSIGSVIADLLRPDRNAVLLWKQHPTPEDLDQVNGCLK